MKRYQIRYAAGVYWLLDMEPLGKKIPKPLELNETAATMWQMLEEGKSTKEIAHYFADGDNEQENEILHDVEEFIKELRKNKIEI
ncbi:MAG: PqqD family protein [Clostridiales bacterium]|nr:PqqD family protein [Eubacterium sp.]MDD5993758.1 PqqD family protein [Clostridiales bacterium]MDD7348799.1 PqqD family protein [Clostridiales bacterium]MDY3775275.1 PqqD family protein [Eubacterium sp.]